jgi:type II secretory pathway pseudopilin PulG
MNPRHGPTSRIERQAGRRGFTMTEMLVIIGIILLVLAIALPAFTAIVGSRSIESAQNIVSASVVRARGEAIRRGQPCGVYFYVDPDSGRTGVAVVTLDPLADLDRYDEYKSFTRGTMEPTGLPSVTLDYQGGSYDPLSGVVDEPSMTSDRAVTLANDGVLGGPPDDPTTANFENTYGARYQNFNGRPIVLTRQHTSRDTDRATPGNQNPGVAEPGPGDSSQPLLTGGTSLDPSTFDGPFVGPNVPPVPMWAYDEIGSLELIDGIQTELLPPGVGLQVVLGRALEDVSTDGAADATGYKYAIPDDDNAGPGTEEPEPAMHERYTRAGLILFDPEGHLVQEPYRIYASSRLGRVMGLDLVDDPDNPGTPIEEYVVEDIPATLGVVLYDRDEFDSAAGGGTALVWKGGFIASLADPTTPIDDFTTSEGDVTFIYPPADRPFTITAAPPVGDYRFHEYAEERWLDANTIPLLINRYSGVVVEAE